MRDGKSLDEYRKTHTICEEASLIKWHRGFLHVNHAYRGTEDVVVPEFRDWGLRTMRQILMLIVLVASPFIETFAQASNQKPHSDPISAKIVTSDIGLFWRAYDQAKPENDLIVYRDQYLKKGSPGLKDFTRTRISSSCALVDTIEKHRKYYAALRESSLRVTSFQNAIGVSFVKLKELYPDAVFPDVYFLIGRMNSAGTVTDTGLLIGVDMFGLTKDTDLEEMSDWHKAVLKSIDDIPLIVAHELIHYQQNYPKPADGEVTLLQQAIDEGSADFISQLIAGSHINEKFYIYGNAHEKELWVEFRKGMLGTDTSKWLYQGDKAKERPADLGYFVGYKICEAYYRKATDKKQAVKDILTIKDFRQFLQDSGDETKFASDSQRDQL